MGRGVNVPDDPNCLEQMIHESTVEEYYQTGVDRDARVKQLAELNRNTVTSYYTHETKSGRKNVHTVRWVEPRGEDR